MGKKIYIDSEKCIGCSLCAKTCEQSAIEMVDGKAKVTNKQSCDKIGRCLPVCPVSAITFIDDDEKNSVFKACPSNNERKLEINSQNNADIDFNSQLKQWPVQIKLVIENADFFDNCDLLISADCTAYAYANFHNKFMKNRVTLIGCPKLDMIDYSEKLTRIFQNNKINSINVVKMEVPCCNGIEIAVKNAINDSGKDIPCKIFTISIDGKIL